MKEFNDRLSELIKEKKISIKELSERLELKSPSAIYKWKNSNLGQTLEISNKIANIFNCSLDYLYGITQDNKFVKSQELTDFGIRFRKVLKLLNVKQQKLRDDKVLSNSNLANLLNGNSKPNIETVIKIAEYLNISLDFLVGRE